MTISPDTAHKLDQTLLWLCSVASPIGDEAEICTRVSERLANHAPALPIVRVLNSLVVPLGKKRDGLPTVALVGHLDTVRTENGPARIEGGRCFGAGASDMKSGLAVMLVLAETLRFDALPCNVLLVFYSREEGPYAENELGPVLEQVPELAGVDLAVCMEPSDNRVHLGCTGSIHATVTFEGRTAHSARPWEGENAVNKAAPLLTQLAELVPKASIIDGHTYRTVTTVTAARDGARGRNVVPDRFILNLNHRFAPDIPIEQAKRSIFELVNGRAQVELTDVSPGALPNANHPLVQSLIASGARSVEPKQAWTDVARFAARGIPAVNFGPGENAQAHQKNESTSLALVHESYAILRGWLERGMTQPR